jgi:hypothetical protein
MGHNSGKIWTVNGIEDDHQFQHAALTPYEDGSCPDGCLSGYTFDPSTVERTCSDCGLIYRHKTDSEPVPVSELHEYAMETDADWRPDFD